MTQAWRTLTLLGAAMALIAAPARAAEDKKKDGDASKSAQTIQMEAVALPIIVNGTLINYVFVGIKLELEPNVDGAAVRAKEQFFRDDLVRIGHKQSFGRMDDYNRVDDAKVRAELMRAAPGIIGPNILKTATITKQTAQKMLATPGAAQKRAPEIVP